MAPRAARGDRPTIQPGFDAPRITLTRCRRLPRGRGNVLVEGLWGYTEGDGTPEGRTPPAIRRACMLLALRSLVAGEWDNEADENVIESVTLTYDFFKMVS